MRVTEHLDRATSTLFSYEIIPPKRGGQLRDIIDIVEQIVPFAPPFIDVTSHAAEASYEELPDGTIRRRVSKKRPGTLSICGIIQNRWGIDTVPHLLCAGFTREETEDAVIELNYLGISNVLAIRGDVPNFVARPDPHRTRNRTAADLVTQLADLRQGRYLDDLQNSAPIDMCVGVGGYPEKHFEAPNLKVDIQRLKEKVAAGADYVVSQLFLDNRAFFEFERRCREAGIDVPIIPGIKLLENDRQLATLPRHFHVTVPESLADEVAASPRHAAEIGARWARSQVAELIAHGVPCIHFYVMNDARPVLSVIRALG
ncbi:MAG TPA: methylenetetrahydrofolate reductase [Candidatus Krumholzibacteria bacterium]|nr:methylenetetrahydrofolate reductase [Candidatus Krumholzibacteria bacterium]HPD72342.1 methylenetetrahydrofolate reductase [Candidatus Krumholzibacteria bacterium]HRY40726.1 methylenetetrahydrofolate reductase [Candidatus Krumholzibacteria bacterium]